MNLLQFTILAVIYYLCYVTNQCINYPMPSSGCTATAMTPELYNQNFVGKVKVLYNITNAGANDIDCYYLEFNSSEDNQTANFTFLSRFRPTGDYLDRFATLAFYPNSPVVDTYNDTEEHRFFSGIYSKGVFNATSCFGIQLDYIVGCKISDCNSTVQESATAIAQNIINNYYPSAPLSKYAINQSNCTNVPT